MKLRDYQRAYQDFSGKASDVARQLGFAGFALIWIFTYEVNGIRNIPDTMVAAGLFLGLSLFCDLAQYVAATWVWGRKQYELHDALKAEKSETGVFRRDANFYHKPSRKRRQLILFILKLLFLALGYLTIAAHFISVNDWWSLR